MPSTGGYAVLDANGAVAGIDVDQPAPARKNQTAGNAADHGIMTFSSLRR